MKMTMIPIVIDTPGTIPTGLVEGAARVWNRRSNCDHSNFSIIEIIQNTENIPSDLGKPTITHTSEKDY